MKKYGKLVWISPNGQEVTLKENMEFFVLNAEKQRLIKQQPQTYNKTNLKLKYQ